MPCVCQRAFFCSEACREKGNAHFEICKDFAALQTEEQTMKFVSNWLTLFVRNSTDYTRKVQSELARPGAISFFDSVSMVEDEIALLFSPSLAISRIDLKKMPVYLKEFEKDDPLRESYTSLYRSLLFSPKPRAFFEVRVLFQNKMLRAFRAEFLPPVELKGPEAAKT
jgi:hypothetical protein